MIKNGILILLLLLLSFGSVQSVVFAEPPTSITSSDSPKDIINKMKGTTIGIDRTQESFDYAHEWFYRLFGGFIFNIFDNVDSGGVDVSNHVTILSHALGFTNVLALFLAAVIVFYVMLGGAVNTAASGEVLGKNWSSTWLPVRTATGLGLIMPMSGLGAGVLSVIQVFIIWLLLMGSNAATLLWGYIVDLMIEGKAETLPVIPRLDIDNPFFEMSNMLICADIKSKNRQAMSKAGKGNGDGTRLILAKVYLQPVPDSSLVSTKGKIELVTADKAVNFMGQDVMGFGTGRNYFAGEFSDNIDDGSLRKISFGLDDSCGSIVFKVPEDGKDNDNYYQKYFSASYKAAAKKILKALDMLAFVGESLNNKQGDIWVKNTLSLQEAIEDAGEETFHQYLVASDADMPKLKAELAETLSPEQIMEANAFRKIFKDYRRSLKEYREDIYDAVAKIPFDDDIKKEDLKRTFTKGGWGQAGKWFLEYGKIAQIPNKAVNTLFDGIQSVKNHIIKCEMDIASFFSKNAEEVCEENAKIINSTTNLWNSFVYGSSVRDNNSAKTEDIVSARCNASSCDVSEDEILTSWSKDFAQLFIGTLANNSDNAASYFDNGPSKQNRIADVIGLTTPFETLSTVGHNINALSFSTLLLKPLIEIFKGISWVASAVAFIIPTLTGNAPAGMAAGSGFGAIAGILSMLVTVAVILLPIGFIMAYFIPFMPLFVWIHLIVNYLITAIEAVVAAPLSVVQMATPEGEGISGTRLERAMSLLAAAIFKPSLMIIGLIAAIFMCNISFAIVNEFFWDASNYIIGHDVEYMNDAYKNINAVNAGTVALEGAHDIIISLVDVVMLMILYCMLALSITKMSINVMGKLPEDILNWFSSGASKAFGNEVSSEMSQSISHSSSVISNVGSPMASGMGDSAKSKGDSGSNSGEGGNTSRSRAKPT